MKRFLKYSILFLFLAGCYTVPETGRTTLNLPLDGMWRQKAALAFKQLKEEKKISEDVELNNRVKAIGTRIVSAIGPRGGVPPVGAWDFVVFDDPESINAFAMPGGKVAVYTGLFKAMETDEELAFVIGHEIAHVTARHGGERMSQAMLIGAGGYGVSKATEDQDAHSRRAILMAYGAITTYGYALPYSRSHESEADQIGLLYMARAGYDPAKAMDVWNKMGKASKSKSPPEWLSTHPAHKTRTMKMRGYLPYASSEYRRWKHKQAGK